jgi:hypothetical protein
MGGELHSSLLNLQTLERQYDLVMTQYKQAYLDYISTLQTQTSQNIGTKYNVLSSRRFWGDGGLTESTVNSISDCEALCSADKNCSGATFNSSNNYCWTRTGYGDVFPGSSNENAIIPDTTQNLNNLKMLNDQLVTLNQQIIQKLNSIQPNVQSEIDNKDQQKQIMNDSYTQLLTEREKINNLFERNFTHDEQYKNNNLYAKTSNSKYIFWLIIAIITIIITFSLLFSVESRGSDYFRLLYNLILISAFLVTIMNMNTIFGFTVFLLLFIYLIVTKIIL